MNTLVTSLYIDVKRFDRFLSWSSSEKMRIKLSFYQKKGIKEENIGFKAI